VGREARLDRIARELASGEVSRRSALKRLAGIGAGLGAATVPSIAEALGGGCPGDRVKCDGKCCPKNARCRRGKCRCKAGFKKCGRKCVDLDTSLKHCGACSSPCADGETCVNGVCGDCSPGDTQPCYTGPPGTENVGACQAGSQTCNQEGEFGPCVGDVTPQPETCNGIDDDCDGTVDNNVGGEPCVCGSDPGVTVCTGGQIICQCQCTGNEGAPCDTGNLCETQGTCQGGTCVGQPVVCNASDQCHNAGTCDPQTGLCSNPAKPDGTSCNDGDACTQTDTCQGGVCMGGNPVVCTAQDDCHDAGTCNPATGQCSNPEKPNGTACNGGAGICVAGACVPN
jgi:hypothetical protein